MYRLSVVIFQIHFKQNQNLLLFSQLEPEATFEPALPGAHMTVAASSSSIPANPSFENEGKDQTLKKSSESVTS